MRLFIGIAPDKAARRILMETAAFLSKSHPAHYADASLYHLTLAFLGELTPDAIPSILQAMEQAAKAAAPFPITLGRLGAFGSILWRGVEDDTALNTLAAHLRDALAERAIPFDASPFRAHITLARDVKGGLPAGGYRLPGGAFTASAITLYESKRVDGTLRYQPLHEVYI